MSLILNLNTLIFVTSLLTTIAAFRLILASNRPYIGLSLRFEANNYPVLIVENIGNRTARNVTFKFSNDYTPLIEEIGAKDKSVQDTEPFKNGIAALVPGELAAYMFYMDAELWGKKEAVLLRVNVTYSRKHNNKIFKFKETISLDINDFKSRLRSKNIPN